MRRLRFKAKNKRAIYLLVVGYMTAILIVAFSALSGAVTATTIKGVTIAIDPGHGGYDPGAITSQGLYEKDINLAIAKKVKAEIAPTGAKVVLTREDDRDYVSKGAQRNKTRKQTDLDYRLNLIEQANADILVSIHVNAVRGGRKSGAETFYQQGSEQGKILAEHIQDEMRKVPTMNKRVAKPGQFYMTRKTKVAAVIVELGYLSNPGESQKLQQEWYQEQLAGAVTRGIVRYLAETK